MINFNDSEILSKALVGVEFEFYSNLSIEDTSKQLSDLLAKKIRIETKAHSDFQVTPDEFKIEPDMSGGRKLMELVTGPQPYYAGRLMIIKVCDWIAKNGYTNNRSSIHLNLSFDPKLTGEKNRISKMNVLKFILDFKEDQVFKFFPKREDSAYAKSIKFVLPKSDTYFYDGKNINSQNFIFPETKYYGINFEKRHKNYLEFRYLGGENWHKRTTDILYLLDQFLLQLWKSTESQTFTQLNSLELKKILGINDRIIRARKDWRNIEKGWKDIKFTVDLKNDAKILDLYWPSVKDRVIKLFTHGEIEKGHINYDSDLGKVQVNDGRLPYCVDIQGYDFVNCFIRGEFKYCDVFSCDVHGSDIDECNFYKNTQINSSKIKSSYVHQSVSTFDSYVYGKGVFKGSMIRGIFREGTYDEKLAQFDDKTEIVNSKKL